MKKYINMGTEKNYKCPLCEKKDVTLYRVEKHDKSCTEYTYIWICKPCPHVSYEYWDDEDLKNFNLFMKGKLKEEEL